VLVNNAGILLRGSVADFSLEDFDRMVSVNVRAIFAAVQEASKHMGEGGRIVNIGSMVADRTGFPGAAFYGMTKAAVASMTRGFAIDLAPRGITVNNIQPGPTKTDMNPADGPSADMLRSLIPLKRYGTADEVGVPMQVDDVVEVPRAAAFGERPQLLAEELGNRVRNHASHGERMVAVLMTDGAKLGA
jgi:3-oxoacyl-[acyl-carrier protein] reductase